VHFSFPAFPTSPVRSPRTLGGNQPQSSPEPGSSQPAQTPREEFKLSSQPLKPSTPTCSRVQQPALPSRLHRGKKVKFAFPSCRSRHQAPSKHGGLHQEYDSPRKSTCTDNSKYSDAGFKEIESNCEDGKESKIHNIFFCILVTGIFFLNLLS